ncbi:MAG TPA: glutamate-cysteine ligase family protein [Kiritimatiellia bacterium]|nr:glutamate-cysteine ligase family protein [Kiritimatiellia bacterium]
MTTPFSLFERVGLELEYMLVDRATLDVRPEVDRWFAAAARAPVSDWEDGAFTWSNELVRHVAELKVTEPVASFAGLAASLHERVIAQEPYLDALGACLMPTAMHPWMDPARETQLWPLDAADIYLMFDRLFDCRRHGWANLQSAHINLPFADDHEFARLHAAIRVLLPLLPALAAASPFHDGHAPGPLDARLHVYANNARRIPSISGRIIPEPVWTQADYLTTILEPMYRDIAPLDPQGILQHEFLNARGAIARFDRNAIEIRLIDIQESPVMDVAIAEAVVHAARKLVDRFHHLQDWPVNRLRAFLDDAILHADQTLYTDTGYLRSLGLPSNRPLAGRDIWKALTEDLEPADAGTARALDLILNQGPLARRMLKAAPAPAAPSDLLPLYRELCSCLAANRPFSP